MSSADNRKKCRSVFLSIGLAVLGVLFGPPLRAQAPNPVPLINQPLVPDATAPGGPQFTLTVNGTGFVSNSTVDWNGSPLATTFVSGSQLTAVVPASDIATANTGWVTVVNAAPGGGTSNTTFFPVAANTGNSVAFTQAPSPGTGLNPYSVAIGDFNGDGKLDLVTANYCGNDPTCNSGGTASVFWGDGSGNFTLVSSPAVAGWPTAVAVGDFNGDGKLDLAVASCGVQHCVPGSGSVSILLGDGTGNFTLASSAATGEWPWSVAVGDFNRDGNLDLAVANDGAGTVSILLGDGTGNFTTAATPYAGGDPWSIATGDFNGDGNLDLAVTDFGAGTVSILLGDGTGNFTLASSPTTGIEPMGLAVGDFNADGNLDLAVGNQCATITSCPPGPVAVLLGDGTGNFTLSSSVAVTASPASLAVGDFNGDGKPDLAVGSEGGTVLVLLGDGAGNFSQASSTAAAWGSNSIGLGDFNGDGKLDVAVPSLNGSAVSILLQAGPAVTLSPAGLSFGTQLLGTTSSAQTVTLTNTGGETLGITSITASANFSETNTCSTSVAAGASCSITVTFSPLGVGTLTGSITITDNASNSPQTVSLTGVGTEVTLSPSSLNFYKQSVGTTSAPQTITLTNHGDQALVIAAIHVGGADAGDFAQTNTCGRGVAPGSSCAISVTFTPQAKGSRQAVIGVRDNGGASPQTVSLRGYGM